MIPLMHCLIFATSLFIIGLFGVMIRRNLFFLLLSVMIMLNGTIVALVSAGYHWQQANGQVISLFVVIAALSEAGVGLALLVKMIYRRKTLNIDSLSEMKG